MQNDGAYPVKVQKS